MLRRVLGRRVSVEQLLETLMWLAIPYLVVGLGWSFFHAEQVGAIEKALLTRLPAGANLVAFGVETTLWPLLPFAGDICVTP